MILWCHFRIQLFIFVFFKQHQDIPACEKRWLCGFCLIVLHLDAVSFHQYKCAIFLFPFCTCLWILLCVWLSKRCLFNMYKIENLFKYCIDMYFDNSMYAPTIVRRIEMWSSPAASVTFQFVCSCLHTFCCCQKGSVHPSFFALRWWNPNL